MTAAGIRHSTMAQTSLIPCVSCAHMVAPDGQRGNCQMGHLLALPEPERFPTRSTLLHPNPLLRRVAGRCVDHEPINAEVTPWL